MVSGNAIAASSRSARNGYTYLGLLLLIAVSSMALAGAGSLWRFETRRTREQELLRVGSEFRDAIGMYYERTPGVVKKYPPTLEALLKDERYTTTQRYLRRIYPDPLTGRQAWGILEAPGGGIMGVYSLSSEIPIKVANFRLRDKSFEGKKDYSGWVFAYLPAVGRKTGG